jgi:hypothetical protein
VRVPFFRQSAFLIWIFFYAQYAVVLVALDLLLKRQQRTIAIPGRLAIVKIHSAINRETGVARDCTSSRLLALRLCLSH